MKSEIEERPRFEEILPGTYLLKVPFGPVWTGVVLIRPTQGDEGATRDASVTVLIDSSHLEPEQYLIPALADLGLKLSDIDWLLNTHVHGDHIGGHHALVAKYGLKVACLEACADALRDPVKVAIRVRTKFPKNSPAPQSYLKGVEPSVLLKERELLAGRFYAIATPGHDDDCVTWVDTMTHTGFTGDSLQANGTPTQGIGFYRDLPAYRATLEKLVTDASRVAPTVTDASRVGVLENLVCGHDYDGIGSVILGRENVMKALRYCVERVELYGRKLGEYCGKGTGALTTTDEDALVPLALKLIDDVGCGRPQSLFLALHTVEQHLKEIMK